MKKYYIVKEERNIIHTVKRREANWIGYILRMNCLLKHVIEEKIKGEIEVTGVRERRCNQLLNERMEMKECWKLKEKALDPTLRRTGFRRFYGPLVRQSK